MSIPPTKHEKTKVDMYIQRGFTASYRVVDGELMDLETEKRFAPSEVTIHKEHRYEGMTNPDDMSILYAIITSDGCKGTAVVPYGHGITTELAEFMVEVSRQK